MFEVFFVEFFFYISTENLKIEGVRCCMDSEVLWDKPVIFGFINKPSLTSVDLCWMRKQLQCQCMCFSFGISERCVCVTQVVIWIRARLCVSVELQPSSWSCPSRQGLLLSEGRPRRWGHWMTVPWTWWEEEEMDEEAGRKSEEESL